MLATDNQLTVIILNKNGAKTLLRCLESVQFAHQVILADDYSSDDSVAIALKKKAKVIRVHASESFSEKRNLALKTVPSGWVLFIDNDEEVTQELQDEILKGIQNPSAVGYLLKREDVFLGKHLRFGETSHIYLLRLARVGTGQWERKVHETWSVMGKIQILPGVLLHFPHPNLEQFIDSINTYSQLEVQERIPDNLSLKFKDRLYRTYCLQLLLYPIAKFIKNTIFYAGFLDGFEGIIQAWWMSFHSLCVRIKVLEQLRQRRTTSV